MEKILTPNPDRYTVFPIKYPDLWALYKKQVAVFWTSGDIDVSADRGDWDMLIPTEKKFILNILAFFAGSDGIVLENLMGNFGTEVQISEARSFYSIQGAIETIHGEVYSLLIEEFSETVEQREELFKATTSMPCVRRKAEWAETFMNRDTRKFSERLVAFAVVEGIFFSGSFCAIFWFKSQNKLVKALGTSNELIARDEGLHCEFAVALYHHLENKLSQEEIEAIVKPAVELESEFICDSIDCPMIGMNAKLMKQYIQFVADRLMKQLGYKSVYNVTCPFSFMENIGLEGKTNFFEKRVTEYVMSGSVMGDTTNYGELKDF